MVATLILNRLICEIRIGLTAVVGCSLEIYEALYKISVLVSEKTHCFSITNNDYIYIYIVCVWCVCVCVWCVYVCVYVCSCVCVFMCMCVWCVYVCLYVCVCGVCVCVFVCVCGVCVCVCVWCVCVYVYVCVVCV